ncbi:MAG: penicillin-binding protein activator [Enterobacteriaceae bacterium]
MLVSMLFNINNRLRLLALALLSFILLGCQSTPPEHSLVISDPDISDQQYLRQLQQDNSSQGIDQQLLAAHLLLQRGKSVIASELLYQLPKTLTATQLQERQLLEAEIYAAQKQPVTALMVLDKLHFNQLSPEQQKRYQAVRTTADKEAPPVETLRLLISQTANLQGEARQNNLDQIWSLLTSLPASDIQSQENGADDALLQGWLSLLHDYRQQYSPTESSAQQWQAMLDMWRISHPHHPASEQLPSQLLARHEAPVETKALNVALFLPLNGQAKIYSQAIEQGFMDSAQPGATETNAEGVPASANAPAVKVYDTSQRPLAELLQEAECDSVDIVVGPFLKNAVEEIAKIPTSLKILTLNEPEQPEARDNICYFALAPEDEARDAASHIWSQDKRLPLVLIPHGELGQRIASAFAEGWQRHSTTPALVQSFASVAEMKEQIQRGVGLPLSGTPLQAVQQTPASVMGDDNSAPIPQGENTAPQQIDALYIVATQAEMALLKPLLDMNSSTLRPAIYLSSRSYQSPGTSSYRLELEGAQYSEIPLLAGSAPEQLASVSQRFNHDYTLVRLYAMGMDARALVQRFNQMKMDSHFQFNGQTGVIRSDNHCVLSRKLSWLTFQQGQPRPAQ